MYYIIIIQRNLIYYEWRLSLWRLCPNKNQKLYGNSLVAYKIPEYKENKQMKNRHKNKKKTATKRKGMESESEIDNENQTKC